MHCIYLLIFQEIYKRTKILIDKSDYIYQINHLASNKRRSKKRKLESHEHHKEKTTSTAKNGPVCRNVNNLSSNLTSTPQQSSPLEELSVPQVHNNTLRIPSIFQNYLSTSQPSLSQTPILSQSPLTLSTSFNKNFGSISSPNIQENRFSSYNRNELRDYSNFYVQSLSHHSSSVPFSLRINILDI